MFDAFKNIKKESSDVYKSRALDILSDIGEVALLIVGGPVALVVFCVVFILGTMVGLPIFAVLSLLEWIFIPIPYYILTGYRYYNVNESLIKKYVDFIEKFGL